MCSFCVQCTECRQGRTFFHYKTAPKIDFFLTYEIWQKYLWIFPDVLLWHDPKSLRPSVRTRLVAGLVSLVNTMKNFSPLVTSCPLTSQPSQVKRLQKAARGARQWTVVPLMTSAFFSFLCSGISLCSSLFPNMCVCLQLRTFFFGGAAGGGGFQMLLHSAHPVWDFFFNVVVLSLVVWPVGCKGADVRIVSMTSTLWPLCSDCQLKSNF